ncbi:MAG: hypothetical protein GY725_12940 [bacterium]|nr:hypothetical protein [bacterium]
MSAANDIGAQGTLRNPPAYAWETALTFGVALAMFASYLDHTPQWDELYHMLAARSWLAEGTFRIADGSYPRAWAFTRLISWFLTPGDTSLVAARIPAALAGAGLVALLFKMTADAAGRRAGWIAASLLATYPVCIYLSQIVRFYTLQALLFALAAFLLYRMLARPSTWPHQALRALLLVAFLVFANELQPLTQIGTLGLVVFAGLVLGLPILLSQLAAGRAWLIAGLFVAGAMLFAAVVASGVLDDSWALFRHAPGWAEHYANDRRVYDRILTHNYPTLWPLLPVVTLVALRRTRDFTLLCVSVFGIGLVASSLAASKAHRYLFPAMPFFFALAGIAISETLPVLQQLAREAVRSVLGADLPSTAIRWLSRGVSAAVLGFVVVTNPVSRDGLKMLVLTDAQWPDYRYRGFADWERAAPLLAPLAEQAEVVLTSAGVKSLFYLGRMDYDVSATLTKETDTGGEFGIDAKTGRPVIASADSLRRLMAQHRSGLVVMEVRRWRIPFLVPEGFADELVASTRRVDLPKDTGLMVFEWGGISRP